MAEDGLPSARRATQDEGGWMKNKRCMLVAILSGMLLTLGLPDRPAAAAGAEPRHILITARRFAFEPADLTLKKGEPVVLIVKSSDVAHGLRFRELNVDIKVSKASTTQVSFTPDKAGDFVGHCSVFCGAGHGSMKLILHVLE
jgi:cytochrome c oxidase subunit II